MHTDRAKGRNKSDVTCAVPGVDPQVPGSSCSLLLDDKWFREQRTGVPGVRRWESRFTTHKVRCRGLQAKCCKPLLEPPGGWSSSLLVSLFLSVVPR